MHFVSQLQTMKIMKFRPEINLFVGLKTISVAAQVTAMSFIRWPMSERLFTTWFYIHVYSEEKSLDNKFDRPNSYHTMLLTCDIPLYYLQSQCVSYFEKKLPHLLLTFFVKYHFCNYPVNG